MHTAHFTWSRHASRLCSRPLGALGLGRLGRLGGGSAVVGREALLEELFLKLVEVRACRLVARVVCFRRVGDGI